VRAGRRLILVVVLGVGAVVAIWLGLRRHSGTPGTAQSEPFGPGAERFAGKWTFVEGTMKTDWDFQGAPDKEKHEMPLAGKSITVVERDGALWTSMEGDPCLIMLAKKGPNVAEMVAGKTLCPEGADAGQKPRPKSTQMTLSLDAGGRGHVTGMSQFSLEVDGKVHEGRLDFSGVADKQANASP
jgi:hypothetical protein